MRILLISIFMLFAILFVGACSNGGNEPLSGALNNGKNPANESLDSIPIINPAITPGGNFNATCVLGAYNLEINPVEMTADLISKRSVSVGESYIVSGTAFFTMTPCSDCLKIKSVALTTDGYIKLAFYIRHPFLPGDVYKPPTGRNRLDLDIFDLALLVHPVETTPTTYPLTGDDAYTGVLANSSGYTTELADVITDNAAFPYVLIIDDSTSGTPTYNKFAMGAEGMFDAIFNLTGDLNFDLYLTMGYGASAKKADRLIPRYLNPEFNRKSAWKVVVTPPQGTNPPQFGNTWRDNDSSETHNVTVKVYDWQIGANVNPDLTNDTDIYALSDVASVSVEIPE